MDLVKENDIVIGVLPTGYGKSSLAMYYWDEISSLGRFIHVLPLRAIVEDLAKKLTAKLGQDVVAYQARIDLQDVVKSPFLSALYNIVTIDSYSYNFYGVPVAEMFKSRWHSDIAYTLASTANIVLDEVHLLTATDSAEEIDQSALPKLLNVVNDVIVEALKGGHKCLILSATIPPAVLKWLLGKLRGDSGLDRIRCAAVVYGSKEFVNTHRYLGKLVEVLNTYRCYVDLDLDESFHSMFEKLGDRYRVELDNSVVDESGVVGKVKQLVDEGFKKIVVFMNTVSRACKLFEILLKSLSGETPVLLLHGRVSTLSRRRVLDVINKLDSYVLISTQVIEAGVDISFDAGITAPAPPQSLVQRIGRVCRYGEKPTCRFVILKNLRDGIDKVYSEEYVEKTLDMLSKEISRLSEGWRFRSLSSDGIDYSYLLWQIDEKVEQDLATAAHSLYSQSVRIFLDDLRYLHFSPERAMRDIDEKLKGSIVRDFYVMPIVVPCEELGEAVKICIGKGYAEIAVYCEIESIEIDLNQLNRRFDVLEAMGDREAVAVFRITTNEKQYLVCKRINLNDLVKHPSYTLYKVYPRRNHVKLSFLLDEYDYGGSRKRIDVEFLGLLSKREKVKIRDVELQSLKQSLRLKYLD